MQLHFGIWECPSGNGWHVAAFSGEGEVLGVLEADDESSARELLGLMVRTAQEQWPGGALSWSEGTAHAVH
jgi:hypothetical protein